MEPKPKKKRSPLEGYKTYDPAKEGYGNRSDWKSAWNERMNYQDAKLLVEEHSPLGILGFDKMPTMVELKKRYRKLVLEHQDCLRADATGEMQEKAKRIIAAYTVLEKDCE